MALAAPTKLRGEDAQRGAYLRKGKRLMWVAGTFDGKVALENAMYPALPLVVLPVRRLLDEGWELVRRAVPASSAD